MMRFLVRHRHRFAIFCGLASLALVVALLLPGILWIVGGRYIASSSGWMSPDYEFGYRLRAASTFLTRDADAAAMLTASHELAAQPLFRKPTVAYCSDFLSGSAAWIRVIDSGSLDDLDFRRERVVCLERLGLRQNALKEGRRVVAWEENPLGGSSQNAPAAGMSSDYMGLVWYVALFKEFGLARSFVIAAAPYPLSISDRSTIGTLLLARRLRHRCRQVDVDQDVLTAFACSREFASIPRSALATSPT